jgi:hypothetical protein
MILVSSSCDEHPWKLCIYGHCPLFTQTGAAVAFTEGAATDVARVVAGASAVAVAPMLMAVGSNFIVGTTGDTYAPVVDESPDPPATLRGLGALGWVQTSVAAATTALIPSPAETRISRCVRIDYLQQQAWIAGAPRRTPDACM